MRFLSKIFLPLILLSALTTAPAQTAYHGVPPAAWPTYPSWREQAVLVLTNAVRMAPVAYRNVFLNSTIILQPAIYPAVPPLFWHVDLDRSARAHAADMSVNCSLQHNSCDGTLWSTRIRSFYTGGGWIAENIATGYATPQACVNAWLLDADKNGIPAPDNSTTDGHRKNIMNTNLTEMGAGYAYGPQKYRSFWVQDFGGAVPDFKAKHLVSGTHLFLETGKTAFWANYRDTAGAPRASQVVVGGVSQPMVMSYGATGTGTFTVSLIKGSLCRNYHFEFTDSRGNVERYPEAGEFATWGEGVCSTYYVPPQSRIEESLNRDESDIRAAFMGGTLNIYGAGNCREVRIYDVAGRLRRILTNGIGHNFRRVFRTTPLETGCYLVRLKPVSGEYQTVRIIVVP